MKKQRLIAIFCILLMLPLMPSAANNGGEILFSDVGSEDWFFETVYDAAGRGLISGYPDGSFRPEKEVSYAEFLAMCLAVEESGEIPQPVHWAERYHRFAIERGYIKEEDFPKESLDSPIPRSHMALLLSGLIQAREVESENAPPSFCDEAADIRIRESIDVCSAAAVLNGYPDGSFRPQNSLRRSEAAAAVINYMERLDAEANLGGRVIRIFKNGHWLILTDEGRYFRYFGKHCFGEVGPPDPNEGKHPAELMRADHKAVLDEVLASAKISGTPNNYTFTYTQPEIPSRYHFAVDLHIYVRNSQGAEDTVFFKNSDEAWISIPENYDPSAKTVSMSLGTIGGLAGKAVFLRLEIYDLLDEKTLEIGESATYVCIREYDGSTKLSMMARRYFDGEIKSYYLTEPSSCSAFCW